MDSRKASNPDRSGALICLAFAAAVGFQAYRLDTGTLDQPGPGLTPLLYASALAVLSAILLLRSHTATENFAIDLRWRPVLSILAILLLYGLAIEWLGYLICTFVVTALLARTAGVRWVGTLVLAGATTMAVNLLFVRWLAVPLPIGSIFP